MFSREKNNLLFGFLRRPSLKREVGVWGHTAPNAHKSAKFSILLAPVSVGVCLWTVRGMNSVALKFKCWQVMWACCARFMNVLPQCCLSDWMTIKPLRIFFFFLVYVFCNKVHKKTEIYLKYIKMENSAVKRLIASKIRVCVYIIFVCILCIFIINAQTCMYLTKLYYIYI